MSKSFRFPFFSRRFFPLFATQFFGALNDNVFKSALLVGFTFGLFDKGGMTNETLVTLSGGIFILPFVLFSPLAGRLGDIRDKATIVRRTKVVEMFTVFLAILAIVVQSLPFFLGVLFLFGVQSSFFGPVKYAILSHHVDRGGLSSANGFIVFSTFIAILLGTILGNSIIFVDGGVFFLSFLLVVFTVFGLVCAFLVPSAVPSQARVSENFVRMTKYGLGDMFSMMKERRLGGVILANSWFWGLGSVMVSLLPPIAHAVSEEHAEIVNILFVSFVMGIGLGAWFASRFSKLTARRGYFFACLVLMGLMLVDFAFVLQSFFNPYDSLFLMVTSGFFVRMMIDLFFLAALGGAFCVPLYTLLQTLARDDNRSAVFATTNIVNSVLIVLSSLFASFLFGLSFSMSSVFIVFGGLCCVGGVLFFVFLEPLKGQEEEVS